ncbi:MAG: ankyrin repeat domain-containing protein [Wolbachia endosymbiont of Tyrophagus putrescentiae]|nr:ankyrin repeat domain-containing protein [Wolbachia endosymbiont of Tyrophagus putrescentiae]
MAVSYFMQRIQALFENTFFDTKLPILTNNQKRLCKELNDALESMNDTIGDDGSVKRGDIEILRKFLKDNKGGDLKFALNFQQGELGSTVLHHIAAKINTDDNVIDLLLQAGADPSIRNKEGKTPLQVAVSNACYSTASFLLTEKHKKLREELSGILNNINAFDDIYYNIPDSEFDWACDYRKKFGHLKFKAKPGGIAKLENFLAKYENDNDLKIVLNHYLQDGTVLHNKKIFRIKEVVALFLKAGADPNMKSGSGKSVVECVIGAACADLKNKEKYQEIMGILIDAKADIYLRDNDRKTLLHYGTAGLKEVEVEFLLTSIKDKKIKDEFINAQDNNGDTALHHTVSQGGRKSVIELLLDHGARWDIKNKEGDTALHVFAHCADDEAVKVFLEKIGESNVDVENKRGVTPLLIAASNSDVFVMEQILKKKSTVIDHKDCDGNTALHYAARNAVTEENYWSTKEDYIENAAYKNISLLINEEASVNAENNYGQTPLFSAVESLRSGIVEFLLTHGADTSIKDKNGFTVFHFAIKQRNMGMLNVLLPKIEDSGSIVDVLKAKESLSVIDKEGNTLLHHAIKWGCSEEILNFLVENKVDINAKNNNGVAPIHIAAKYGNLSQMEFFIKKKADLNVRCGKFSKSAIDNIGKEKKFSNDDYINVQDGNLDASNTVEIKDDTEHKNAPPISIATESNHQSVVSTLLCEGAKPSIEDSRGWLPLRIAIKRALDKNCTEEEMEERYEIIRKLASVSGSYVESLMSEIHSLDEKIKKILNDAIEREGGIPTVPVDEEVEANVPLFDDNFYDEIDSHIIEPALCPTLHEELASDKNSWDKLEWHSTQLNQKTGVESNKQSNGWGDLDDSTDLNNGTSTWCKSSTGESNEWERKDVYDGSTDDKHSSIESSTDKLKNRQDSFKLTSKQKAELSKFLDRVSKVKNIGALNEMVNEALNSGMRLNACVDEGCSLANGIIKRINELNGVKRNPRTVSNIVCKLIEKGAIFSEEINKEVEVLFRDHKINIQSANKEFCECFNELQKCATNAIISGKLNEIVIDNVAFYLEYSLDSVVDVSKVMEGARSLGLYQGDVAFSCSNIVRIGESEVEVEIKNDVRNYIDISKDSDLILTFHTSQGELDVRLYPDKGNDDIIKVEIVEIKDQGKFVDIGKEIGKNCQFGGLTVFEAIEQGYFTRSGKFQSSKMIDTRAETKKVAEEIVEGLENCSLDTGKVTNWQDKIRAGKTQEHSRDM